MNRRKGKVKKDDNNFVYDLRERMECEFITRKQGKLKDKVNKSNENNFVYFLKSAECKLMIRTQDRER